MSGKTFEEALQVFGARRLGLPDDTQGIEVRFRFDAWSVGGCETCGPDVEKEFEIVVTGPDKARETETKTLDFSYEGDEAFKEVLAELVDITREKITDKYADIF